MTDVQTTLRTAYLAGPMRGIPEYNFPAFKEAATWLRSENWFIFSPAERDEDDPEIDHTVDIAGWNGSRGLDYFMAYDLKAVCEMDAVIMLPGWERSQGARLEATVAVEIGHPVFEILVTDDFPRYRYLAHVSPSRILAEFTAESKGWEELPMVKPRNEGVSDEDIAAAVRKAREAHACQGTPTFMEIMDAIPMGPVPVNNTVFEEPVKEEYVVPDAMMRAFETGATRNVETDPDLHGFTSPLALQMFARYMHDNRTQADGSVRDSDNWKRGIPLDSYIRSLRRHLHDLELHHTGYGDCAREDLYAALSGLFFNVQGYMHETMKADIDAERQEEESAEEQAQREVMGLA